MTLKPWTRVEPTTITKIGHRTIVSKTFVKNSGEKAVFDTVGSEGTEAVDVIALTPENDVVLAKQFRASPEIIAYETPGGIVDSGEDLKVAALRELREETGYESMDIKYVGKFYKDSNINATWHLFMAYNCKSTAKQDLDEDEEIEVEVMPIKDFMDIARNGKTVSAHIPVLMAYDELMNLRKG